MVILLAGGSGTRWQAPGYKQHCVVNGERIIDRTIRLFPECLVMNDRTEILKGVRECSLKQSSSGSSVQAFFEAAPFDDGYNTVLFSDVYYTDDCVQRIRNIQHELAFFTDGLDIFALKFLDRLWGSKLIQAARSLREISIQENFWNLYQSIFGKKMWPVSSGQYLEFVYDATQDFDEHQDYVKFLQGHSKNYGFQRRT